MIALAFLPTSCSDAEMDDMSPDNQQGNVDFEICALASGTFDDPAASADEVESELEHAKTVTEGSDTPLRKLVEEMGPDTAYTDTLTGFFEHEISRVEAVGFDAYLEEKASQGLMRTELSQTIIEFRKKFTGFVAVNEPTLEEVRSFWNDRAAEASADENLCENENILARSAAEAAIGVAQYLYGQNSNFGNEADARDCENFWQKLMCGTAAVIAFNTAISVVVVAAIALNDPSPEQLQQISAFITTICDLLGLDQQTCQNEIIRNGRELALLYSRLVFNACCSVFSDEEIVCSSITDMNFSPQGCNFFLVTAPGENEDAEVFEWISNSNFIFEEQFTTENFNYGSAIDLTQDVSATVIATCPNLTNFDLTVSGVDLAATVDGETFTPTWAQAPPSQLSAPPGGGILTFDVHVNSGTNELVDFSLSTSSGGRADTSPPFSGTITIWNTSPGTSVTTFATITNACTGTTATISKVTNIVN